MTAEEIIRRVRRQVSGDFGGGMIPFDVAYHDALREDCSIAEAQRLGVYAMLDSYTERIIAALPGEQRQCRAPHCWSEYGTPCASCPTLDTSNRKDT